MRNLAVLAVVLGLTTPAAADTSIYVSESFGVGGMNGGLRAYGSSGFRFQVGLGYRRNEHGLELVFNSLWNTYAGGDEGELFGVGLDYRRRFPLAQSRWRGLGARVTLHAGPRWFSGMMSLTGYDGPGFNAGAALEGDIWILGYFIDVGVDAMWMQMPADHVTGYSPHLMIGGRFGWL